MKDARAQADDLAVDFIRKFPNAIVDRNHLGAWFHGAMQIGADMVRPEVERLRVRDEHADECIESRNKRLSEIAVQCDTLRSALVGLVGVDGKDDLEQLEAAMRLMPAPAQDKAVTIDAIHALLSTLVDQSAVAEAGVDPQQEKDDDDQVTRPR